MSNPAKPKNLDHGMRSPANGYEPGNGSIPTIAGNTTMAGSAPTRAAAMGSPMKPRNPAPYMTKAGN